MCFRHTNIGNDYTQLQQKLQYNKTRKIKWFLPVWDISFHHVFVHMLEFYHHIFDLFLLVTIFSGKMCSTFILPRWNQHIWAKKTKSEPNRKVWMKSRKQDSSIYITARSLLCRLASSGGDKHSERSIVFEIVFKVLSLRADVNTGEVKRTGNTALWHRAHLFLSNCDTVSWKRPFTSTKSNFLGMKDSFPNINTRVLIKEHFSASQTL